MRKYIVVSTVVLLALIFFAATLGWYSSDPDSVMSDEEQKRMERGLSEAVYHQKESTVYENAGEGDTKELIGIQGCKSECRKELISCSDEYNKLDHGKNEYKTNCSNPYRSCLASCWN